MPLEIPMIPEIPQRWPETVPAPPEEVPGPVPEEEPDPEDRGPARAL